jgi:hypothetical protein
MYTKQGVNGAPARLGGVGMAYLKPISLCENRPIVKIELKRSPISVYGI